MTTEDLLARAQGGDEDAFRRVVEPHRRELLAHCYRMLGSAQDAEDALQDTLLAAWRGLAGFRRDASVRTWLFRIATNTCLNAIRAAGRRPRKAWDIPSVDPPEPTQLGEVHWLGPLPDAWVATPPQPDAVHEERASISLAFVAALQTLPPGQLAVLVLRDVMELSAAEVGEMLDTTVASVHSSLKRARSNLERVRRAAVAPVAPGSPEERAIAQRFVDAYERADVAALVALFTDDVFVSMPPLALEYVGREAVARFFGALLGSGRSYSLVPTRANGAPAYGAYVRDGDGVRRATGVFVLEIAPDGLQALTRFEAHELVHFDLPPLLRD